MTIKSTSPLHWRTYRRLPGKEEFFPSDASLRWFIRCNEAELVRRGALIRHQRRPMLLPERFDAVVKAIGARQAQRFVRRRDA